MGILSCEIVVPFLDSTLDDGRLLQYKASAEWLEKLMPWQMQGAIAGEKTMDVAWLLELTLEHTGLNGCEIFRYLISHVVFIVHKVVDHFLH